MDIFAFFTQREIRQQLAEKAKAGELKVVNGSAASQAATKRKRRWDQTADQTPTNTTPKKISSWDQADSSAEVGQPFLPSELRIQSLCAHMCVGAVQKSINSEVLLCVLSLLTLIVFAPDARSHPSTHTLKQPVG